MKHLILLVLFVLMCIPCSATEVQQNVRLSELGDFKTIDKVMFPPDQEEPAKERKRPSPSTHSLNNDKDPKNAELYLWYLYDSLSNVPVSNRADLLLKLAKETKSGSYQKFVSCYVCAWYNIDYINARNYLIHSAFWWEWHIGNEKQHPYSFDDVCIDYLYALYERNHDFKILHDIITTQSGAGTGELIEGFTDEAIGKHPRGVLHVADLSAKGHNLVYKIINLSTNDENHPLYISCTKANLRTFRTYINRVANDPKDPLCVQARSLLKKKWSK